MQPRIGNEQGMRMKTDGDVRPGVQRAAGDEFAIYGDAGGAITANSSFESAMLRQHSVEFGWLFFRCGEEKQA